MPFTKGQLQKALGKPSRSEPLVVKSKVARGTAGQRAPQVLQDGALYWDCGCVADLGFGSSYNLRQCADHAAKRGL
jgi:hypothetical protein